MKLKLLIFLFLSCLVETSAQFYLEPVELSYDAGENWIEIKDQNGNLGFIPKLAGIHDFKIKFRFSVRNEAGTPLRYWLENSENYNKAAKGIYIQNSVQFEPGNRNAPPDGKLTNSFNSSKGRAFTDADSLWILTLNPQEIKAKRFQIAIKVGEETIKKNFKYETNPQKFFNIQFEEGNLNPIIVELDKDGKLRLDHAMLMYLKNLDVNYPPNSKIELINDRSQELPASLVFEPPSFNIAAQIPFTINLSDDYEAAPGPLSLSFSYKIKNDYLNLPDTLYHFTQFRNGGLAVQINENSDLKQKEIFGLILIGLTVIGLLLVIFLLWRKRRKRRSISDAKTNNSQNVPDKTGPSEKLELESIKEEKTSKKTQEKVLVQEKVSLDKNSNNRLKVAQNDLASSYKAGSIIATPPTLDLSPISLTINEFIEELNKPIHSKNEYFSKHADTLYFNLNNNDEFGNHKELYGQIRELLNALISRISRVLAAEDLNEAESIRNKILTQNQDTIKDFERNNLEKIEEIKEEAVRAFIINDLPYQIQNLIKGNPISKSKQFNISHLENLFSPLIELRQAQDLMGKIAFKRKVISFLKDSDSVSNKEIWAGNSELESLMLSVKNEYDKLKFQQKSGSQTVSERDKTIVELQSDLSAMGQFKRELANTIRNNNVPLASDEDETILAAIRQVLDQQNKAAKDLLGFQDNLIQLLGREASLLVEKDAQPEELLSHVKNILLARSSEQKHQQEQRQHLIELIKEYYNSRISSRSGDNEINAALLEALKEKKMHFSQYQSFREELKEVIEQRQGKVFTNSSTDTEIMEALALHFEKEQSKQTALEDFRQDLNTLILKHSADLSSPPGNDENRIGLLKALFQKSIENKREANDFKETIINRLKNRGNKDVHYQMSYESILHQEELMYRKHMNKKQFLPFVKAFDQFLKLLIEEFEELQKEKPISPFIAQSLKRISTGSDGRGGLSSVKKFLDLDKKGPYYQKYDEVVFMNEFSSQGGEYRSAIVEDIFFDRVVELLLGDLVNQFFILYTYLNADHGKFDLKESLFYNPLVNKRITYIFESIKAFYLENFRMEILSVKLFDSHFEATEHLVSREHSDLKYELDELGPKFSSFIGELEAQTVYDVKQIGIRKKNRAIEDKRRLKVIIS